MSKFRKYLIYGICLMQIIGMIVVSVDQSVFNIDYFTKVQNDNQVSLKMGISEDDVKGASQVALDYTKGKTDDLSYYLDYNGKNIDIYSSQDKEHMIDVYYLYQNAKLIGMFAMGLLIVLIALVYFKKISLFELAKSFNQVSIFTVIFVSVIGIFAYTNFNVFWTYFHLVFFTNDLWLMNPAVDALVNLFPEALFMALVFKVLFRFILYFIATNILAYVYRIYSLRGLKND